MGLSEERRRSAIRNAGDPGKGRHWRVFSDGKVEAKTTSYENGDLVVHEFRDRYCVLDRQTSYDIGEFSRLKYAKIFCNELSPIWSGLLRRILGSVLIRTNPTSNQDTRSADRDRPDPLPPSSIDPPHVVRPA
jgi:hypothetical protein